MRGISVSIPYLSRSGKVETLNITYELKYRVDNASVSETSASIKANAPATYYTQNRMVTGEDYQIGPLGVSQEIIKAKSVNRTSSGISRYFDLIDATGKYSKTNLFAEDGALYKEYLTPKNSFTFASRTDVEGAIVNTIQPILSDKKLRNYYYDKFPKVLVSDLGVKWTQSTSATNISTGYLTNIEGIIATLGTFTTSILSLIVPGTLCKFLPPVGDVFLPDGTSAPGVSGQKGTTAYKWVKVETVSGNGTQLNEDGTGPVYFNDIVPTGSRLAEVRPAIAYELEDDVSTQVIDQIFAFKTFGLRYDRNKQAWRLITENNLNIAGEFSIGKQGDVTNQQLDASWLLLFETDGEKYTITHRAMRYIFESDQEVRFYFDSSDKIYNNLTGKIVKDKIRLLSINTQPDNTSPFTVDFDYEITEEYRDPEGYVDSKKIQITFFDSDDDGVVDDPQIFEEVVQEKINPLTKIVFQQKYLTTDGVEDYNYISKDDINVIVLQAKSFLAPFSAYENGQLFYYQQEDIFEILDKTFGVLNVTTNYKAKIGRDGLKFQYVHAADYSARIDPSASNIIDTYLLTKSYDTDFRLYLEGVTATKPLPPSTDSLFLSYGTNINKIKSLSDEVIYHPVKYKVLFGDKAPVDLQATFKIVKNPDLVLNDNDVKSRVIGAINEFFALENWDFGDKFYFSELSNYVMNQLAPDLVTFLIVPNQESQTFGSLMEIKSESDEIFISGATVADIAIIDSITASRLKTSGSIVTASTTTNTGIQSI